MTTVSASPLAESDHAAARRLLVPVAVATGVATTFFEGMRADSGGEAITMVALALVANALVYGVLVRRRLDARRAAPVAALVLAIVGLLLTVPAFWSGLPIVLGGAGALLGFGGKRESTRSGMCIAALVVGSLAVIGYLGIYVGDWIAHPGAIWWS